MQRKNPLAELLLWVKKKKGNLINTYVQDWVKNTKHVDLLHLSNLDAVESR